MRVSQVKITCFAFVSLLIAMPAFGQSLPPDLIGIWDVSLGSCADPGTSVTRIKIGFSQIETFGGNAVIREVEQIGDVTFAAGDFQQLEGAAEIAPREHTYFRFDQKDGPDRMTLVWKDIQTVNLFRCKTSVNSNVTSLPEVPLPANPSYDGQLPIPLGLWVVAGDSCQSPANASWRVYDGAGLRGASSTRCEIDATERQGESIVFSQLCTASRDGEVQPTRDRITVTAPRRFTLVEGSENASRDFNWCGPQFHP